MLSTLVCTMFLTLCVDVGWKPAEDGKGEVYVIQIHPEQGEQMIKNKSSVTCGIDERAKEVRVQFGNDILLKDPTTNTLTPNEATTENANLRSPPSPDTLLSPYSPQPPPTVSDVAPTTTPGIVTTSLDSPLEVSVELPNQQAKPSPKKEETPPQTGSDEGTESYLTAAIILGIVSAGLFAMVVYLIWIHLELRRRYQALLDRVLTDSATDLSKGDLAELLIPGLANLSGKGGEVAPWTASSEVQENASTSEEPSKKSTLVESAEDAANAKESKPNLDGMDSLLQNTNQAIAQVPGEAELEAVDPRKKDEEPETVYGLPETSDEESPEESDDDDDIEDDAGSWGDVK